jgi:regulator of cell morphogenesis and NO signaling
MTATGDQMAPATQDSGRASAARVVQRLLREHRRWRSKDFPLIAHLFEEVQSTEGGQPECLAPLRNAFHRLCAEMEGHMTREEHVLFPAILEAQSEADTQKSFGSIRNPIGMLEQEHDWEAERLEKMREIARDYQLSDDANEKLRLLFRELEALEAAMHAHTRLESSILFARALAAERAPKPAA